MEDDEIIKMLSEELLKGAKMLSNYCPKCGYPLLEKDGKIYCPVCNLKNKTIYRREESKKPEDKKIDLDIEEILDEKIIYLAKKLKDESEVSRIKEIGEAIYILIKIKEKIK